MAKKSATQSKNGSVFISYSRKDKEFVKKLNDALDNSGVQAWVDWEGIELASDWMERIREAIHGADAFLFVISPDSIASQVCGEELELGLKNNKKLIPILYREPPKGTKMHEKLESTNWVYLRDKKDDFDETIPKLVEAINTDLDWVHQHTRLLQRALEWQGKNKDNSSLLVGSDLEEAEHWMTEATAKPNRDVLPLQAEYIHDSRNLAARRQRMLLTGVSIALIVSLLLAVFAGFQWNRATIKEKEAQEQRAAAIANKDEAVANAAEADRQRKKAVASQKLAEDREREAAIQRRIALAEIFQSQPGELNKSTLLALQSWNNNPPPDQARKIEDLLRQNISLLPIPIRPAEPMIQPAEISNIQWSANGERFVTSSFGGNACVWSIKDGKKDYCVQASAGEKINDALFTSDDKYLITAGGTKVSLWDAVDGTRLGIEYTADGNILDLDLSPNGRLLAIADDAHLRTVIDLKNLNSAQDLRYDQLAEVFEQSGEAYSVQFSKDGKWLAIGTIDGFVKIWQVNSGTIFDGPQHPGSSYLLVDFSPKNSYLIAGGNDSKASVSKPSDGTQLLYAPLTHGDWVEGLDFSPDDKWFVTVSDDNKVRVWDTLTGKEKLRMEHKGFVQAVKVSPDGQWIATAGNDQTVRIWDAVSGAEMMEIPIQSGSIALSFNKDGTRLVVGDGNGNISIWDISALSARVGYWEFSEVAHEVHFTPNGRQLFINTDDNAVRLFPADNGFAPGHASAGKQILTADSLTYQMAVSPDSNWAGVVERDDYNDQFNKAYLIDLKTQSFYPLQHGSPLTDVAFSADSKWIATAGDNALIYIWDVATRDEIAAKQSTAAIQSIVFGSKWIAAGNANGEIDIYDLSDSSLLPINKLSQAGSIDGMALSHNGEWLATASSEHTIYLWKINGDTFTKTIELDIEGDKAESMAFSPDDGLLAVGSADKKYVYLLNANTGEELARLPHIDDVSGVDFSADGSILATVSRKVVQFWKISNIPFASKNQLPQKTCSHLLENFNRNQWKSIFGENEDFSLICPDLPPASE